MKPTINKYIELCAAHLALGHTLLYPTDTVWGIGCDATNAEAVEQVFAIKQRPAEKSLIVLVDSIELLMQYVDVTPDILREDYRADYVLMVAEAHQSERDPESSARRLAILGSESPDQIVTSTLDYAKNNGFSQDEIALLQNLLTSMQTYQPDGNSTP